MAHFSRWLCFAFLITHSPISLLRHASGEQESFLSVQTPYVYVVSGQDLSLDCIVNGSSLSVDRVSWKNDGKWLHNHTQRLTSRVRLILRKISRQQDGLYQCSVFNTSGQSSLQVIPKEGNVTVFIGDHISKPVCIPSGQRYAPEVILRFGNIIDDYQSVLEFTYRVLYCHKPTPANKYCYRPPFGFNIYQNCSDLRVIDSSTDSEVVNCNVTSLFMRLFPNLYDVHALTSQEGYSLYFIISLGNVHVPRGSFGESVECNPLEKARCTRVENIHLSSLRRKTLSLVWDAPKKGIQDSIKYYWLLLAEDGGDKNQTLDFVANRWYRNISYNFTSLHPYTLYHIYIACSLTRQIGNAHRGEFVGPFSAMTKEEEPTDYPRIVENMTYTVTHKEYRNVTFTWMLPDKETWNGMITRFVLYHSSVSSSRGENVESQVEIFNSASSNTATVTGLRLDEAYVVTMRMCTVVGCGPPSPPVHIPKMWPLEVTTIQASRNKEDLRVPLTIGLTLGVFLAVFSVVMFYIWTKRKHRSRVKRKPLSEVIDIPPPLSYDFPKESTKEEDSGVYDETYAPLLSDKTGGYVQISTTQTVLPIQRASKLIVDDGTVTESTEI